MSEWTCTTELIFALIQRESREWETLGEVSGRDESVKERRWISILSLSLSLCAHSNSVYRRVSAVWTVSREQLKFLNQLNHTNIEERMCACVWLLCSVSCAFGLQCSPYPNNNYRSSYQNTINKLTNGACTGSESLSFTFRFVVSLNLSNDTLGCEIITAHISLLFFLKKKK